MRRLHVVVALVVLGVVPHECIMFINISVAPLHSAKCWAQLGIIKSAACMRCVLVLQVIRLMHTQPSDEASCLRASSPLVKLTFSLFDRLSAAVGESSLRS